jgi:hypothetical protein
LQLFVGPFGRPGIMFALREKLSKTCCNSILWLYFHVLLARPVFRRDTKVDQGWSVDLMMKTTIKLLGKKNGGNLATTPTLMDKDADTPADVDDAQGMQAMERPRICFV